MACSRYDLMLCVAGYGKHVIVGAEQVFKLRAGHAPANGRRVYPPNRERATFRCWLPWPAVAGSGGWRSAGAAIRLSDGASGALGFCTGVRYRL